MEKRGSITNFKKKSLSFFVTTKKMPGKQGRAVGKDSVWGNKNFQPARKENPSSEKKSCCKGGPEGAGRGSSFLLSLPCESSK
jgi:hypothetical protein